MDYSVSLASKVESTDICPESMQKCGLINPRDIVFPLAILSLDDGVVVFANEEFKQIIQSVKVGAPIKGFLSSEQTRQEVSKKLIERDKVTSVFDTANYSLRFSVSQGQFANTDHYIVSLEKISHSDQSICSNNTLLQTREHFLAQLSQLIAQDKCADMCLCVIDIDRFKVVNEKYGYQAGNYLLAKFGEVIAQNIEQNNIIGRLGDNEFAIVLQQASLDEAVRICEMFREAVKQEQFIFKNDVIPITVSIGVISIDGADDIEQILAKLTLALSAAQENGRDCVHSSETQDTMMAYHSGKMQYAMLIEDALQNDKFELFAQPIVDLDKPDSHYCYEVLLRIFDHVKQEFVSSQELISAAESLEVTTRIDEYVCEKVFATLQDKANQQIRVPNISINLSGHSIVSTVFESFLLDLTDKYNVPTTCISFEITENVAVKSITRAQNFIKNLKAVGYRFSLDDFGVGYCSFNYLNQLDVDNVKIDGSFVAAMLDDATQFATVQAITNVARTMNIKTIAEFVEKPEIIKALKVIGVDYGQGYYFGKPESIDKIFKYTGNKGS